MKKVYFSLILLLSLMSIIPFYLMIMIATHVSEDVFKGLLLFPGNYLFENMSTVMQGNFFQYYLNSIIVSTLSTVLCVFVSALTGFALAKYDFKFKKAVYSFILMTMMVPAQSGMVGYIMEMKFLGLNNSLAPLIITWITNAFGVFWMTQFIKSSLPDEIIESARIDGCNEFGIFIKIVIPYIKPAIATLSMLVFFWSWNSYLLPTIVINKKELFTIPLAVANLGSLYRTDYGARMAALTLATIPLILIFIAGSKTFIRGLTAGAVKG